MICSHGPPAQDGIEPIPEAIQGFSGGAEHFDAEWRYGEEAPEVSATQVASPSYGVALDDVDVDNEHTGAYGSRWRGVSRVARGQSSGPFSVQSRYSCSPRISPDPWSAVVRARALLFAALVIPSGVAAQDPLQSGLAAIEAARSGACVGILARVDVLEGALRPLAERSQRLLAIGRAIALEDRSVIDSLRVGDPTEAAVRAWFVADGELGQRYVDTRDPAINEERSSAREVIRARVDSTLIAVQGEADSHIDAAGDLPSVAAPCEGAIFVRSAVVEACRTESSPVCDDAAGSEPGERYRFVDTAADLWDVSEIRPWTDPGPLRVGSSGQIEGARTVGYARQGNVVLTVAFAPLLQDKSELTPEELARFEMIVDSLDFDFSHPDIAFTPSLGVRATLPEPLAGETLYVLHFGEPEDAEVIWTGPAGTGAPVDATVVLTPHSATLLAAGMPISFTAVVAGAGAGTEEGGDNEAVFSIQLTPVSQSRAARALLGYMSSQLGKDLAALIPPGGG